jgi:hypothetical protein
MSDYMKSNPALDAAINSATNVEELREKLLSTLASQGTITRNRQDAYDVRLTSQPPESPTPAVSLPASTAMRKFSDMHCRYVISGNSSFELFAGSEEELNQQELAIRAILAGRP